MKQVVWAAALWAAAGLAYAQQATVKAPAKSNDEAAKAAILKKVEERLNKQRDEILAEVRKMLDETFAKTAKKQPGFLGIEGKEVKEGLHIEQVVKDSPAAMAGLLKDDTITEINGKKASTLKALVGQFFEIGAGGKVEVTYTRSGKTAKATAFLAARQDDDDDGDEDDDDDDDDDDHGGKAQPEKSGKPACDDDR